MHTLSRAARALAVAALPLALAACGPSTGSSSGSSTGDTTTSAKPSPPKDPNAGLMTGTRLKEALAPASSFPAGFVPVPQGASDSGGEFVTPQTESPGKPDCTKLGTTAWVSVSGARGGVSYANDDYVNKDKTAEITEEIDEFPGTAAATAMKGIRGIPATCPSYTDTDLHGTVKVSGRSTTGLGDEAYTITLTSGAWDNGTTLIAARQGTSVVTVLSNDGHDNGAATAKKLTQRIVASLKKTA
ncbi:hypothetical protein [Streptomyces sp. MK7]|uniref:hypothetical protein n=1 Tax=Streptomyces sp. MK7 TaxID=3067635 RepID=UPI0029300132|nr:hypothetical protein [Streptomyces sp. MK7]